MTKPSAEDKNFQWPASPSRVERRHPRSVKSHIVESIQDDQTNPNQSETTVFYVPESQRLRILQRHISGESIRKIARAEGRCRETVPRVVHSEEAEEYIARRREEFVGLADDAIAAVREGLRSAKDGAWLAWEILKALGIVPSDASSSSDVVHAEQPRSTEEEQVRAYVERLALIAIDRNKCYGTELPELDEDIEPTMQTSQNRAASVRPPPH